MVRLTPLSLDDPSARALESALNDEVVVRYGADEPEEPHEASQFSAPAGAFVVAWLQVDGGDEVAVACGGIRRIDDERCELKRMYVAPEARGRGIARLVLERLEREAAELGYAAVWLETGTEQPEAIALYESAGYQRVENFGRYRDEPKVRSFARSLRWVGGGRRSLFQTDGRQAARSARTRIQGVRPRSATKASRARPKAS